MSILYIHLCWFIFMAFFLIVCFYIAFMMSFMSTSLYISLPLFFITDSPFILSFYLDWMSSWFMFIIVLISTIISFYSYNYMAPYSKPAYFIVLTCMFIVSMLLVVTMSDLFFLMLGWDGLGVVSFFLIVYYQNQSSITSGLFTLLMNRVGDSFFLVSIALLSYNYSDYFSWKYSVVSTLTIFFLVVTFMTKSAIYPFSPWLPMAMAAPTPISALVHSSTLVTAGLYLMMRFSSFIYSSYSLLVVLLVLSIFTSFYAGMNTIFETDLKKLIALSTLSHLGFIGMAYSAGLIHLSFFHMLTHALFKSLLFMTMGDIMINLNHSQDIRYLSSGYHYTPFSCSIMYISLFNLLGLPMLSGFYSKDFILESMNYSISSSLVMFILFFNIFFTYYYTYQLFFYSFSSNKVLPYQLLHLPLYMHSILLVALGGLTMIFPYILMNLIYPSVLFVPVPSALKFFPICLNLLVFMMLVLFLKQITSYKKYHFSYFSSMMFLSPLMMSVLSNSYYLLSVYSVKSMEMGMFNYTLNSYLPGVVASFSLALFKICCFTPLRAVLFTLPLVLLAMMFLLSNNMTKYMWLLLMEFLLGFDSPPPPQSKTIPNPQNNMKNSSEKGGEVLWTFASSKVQS